MYRAIIWFLKGRRGLAGPALRDLIIEWESSKSRKHGFGARIFRPSMDAVKRFQPLIPNVDLLSAPINHCCTALRKAMFMELTSSWQSSSTARFTFSLHPLWTDRKLPSTMHSRCSHSWYHSVALGRGPFRDRLRKMRKRSDDFCRYGCGVSEDARHVLLCCPAVATYRNQLRKVCRARDLHFDLRTLLTSEKLYIGVEKLFAAFMAPDDATDA